MGPENLHSLFFKERGKRPFLLFPSPQWFWWSAPGSLINPDLGSGSDSLEKKKEAKIMEWRKQCLFVEATANLMHEETDSNEDLDTHVHFPSCPRCPTHCKRLLWLISATKEFISLFEKLLSVCQISWTLSIFRGSCKCSPVGVSPSLLLVSSSIIFWLLKVFSHLWKVLVVGCDFKLMDFICRIWQ